MLARVVKAEFDHVLPIAENMRDADAIEVWLASRKTPYQAVLEGFEMSVKAWTIMEGNTPIGMFGVSSVSTLGNEGIPWLLGTDRMLKVRRQFIRESQRYLDEIHRLYPKLVNFVHINNVASLRWLSWLGFDFDGPVEAGPERAEFFRFERVSHV